MMKVLKVLVDKIPESCMGCSYHNDNMCGITFGRLTGIRFDARPDWCPLKKESTPHRFADNTVGEPWGKPRPLGGKSETVKFWPPESEE
jgi:hypothetical protein